MPSRHIDELIEEFNKKLGDQPFYTLRQLISTGFFGSMPAARLALKQGLLPFVRISPRRCVIPRHEVMNYLRKNLSQVQVMMTSQNESEDDVTTKT